MGGGGGLGNGGTGDVVGFHDFCSNNRRLFVNFENAYNFLCFKLTKLYIIFQIACSKPMFSFSSMSITFSLQGRLKKKNDSKSNGNRSSTTTNFRNRNNNDINNKNTDNLQIRTLAKIERKIYITQQI